MELSLSPLTVREELPNTDLVYVHSRNVNQQSSNSSTVIFLIIKLCEIKIIVTVVILK